MLTVHVQRARHLDEIGQHQRDVRLVELVPVGIALNDVVAAANREIPDDDRD